MAPTGLSVSIIISTRSNAEALRGTLDAFLKAEVPPGWSVELLLVDNGSTDATAEVIQSFRPESIRVRDLSMPARGKSRALNLAIAEAEGEILAFTDDDVRPAHDWLERLCGPIFAGECDAAVGRITLAPHLECPELTSFHKSWLACTDKLEGQEDPDLVGANMAFRRAILEKVAGFDEELGPGALGFMDDILLAKQIKAAGFRTRYLGDARLEHHPNPARINRSSMLAQAQAIGASEGYLDHHWHHRRFRAPLLQSAVRSLRLGVWRARHRAEIGSASVASPEEFMWVVGISRYRQYAKESKRPRNYALHGLKRG